MLVDIAVGTVIIVLTVLIHTVGLISGNRLVANLFGEQSPRGRRSGTLAMISAVLVVFATCSAEVWLWAVFFAMLGVAPNFSDALYLSTVTFGTVGYGDVVPDPAWRMLAALEGITGFLMIGWSTAYLVVAGTRYGPFRVGQHF